jgi:uncharacterized membrane protein HdeD (DUF308 family)
MGMMGQMVRFDRRTTNSGWWLLLVQGLLLIALAALVLWEPTILVHVAAGMFAVLGVFSLVLAFRLRHMGRVSYRYLREWWWADMPF